MGGRGLLEVSELRLTRGQWDQMRAHVQGHLPEEACGLLAGLEQEVREVLPIANQAHSPYRFRMDPQEQLSAFEHIENQHWQLLGIFHSHPAGPPHPSATDIIEASYDVVYVIWSLRAEGWEANAFSIREGLVSEVKLKLADGQPGSTITG